MSNWRTIEADTPELAEMTRRRIEDTGLGLLATLRADGSPRISGIEPSFSEGELWLGMMQGSLKARDLQRDARFSLHNATVDKDVKDGDVKVSGRALEISDEDEKKNFLLRFEEATGTAIPNTNFHLFKADVTEIASVRPAGDHLVIDTWKEGVGTNRIERRDDATQ